LRLCVKTYSHAKAQRRQGKHARGVATDSDKRFGGRVDANANSRLALVFARAADRLATM
jgi:hypothetical protein